ncbi:MAG: cobalamin-dependent protein [Saprospiraceae bacterium]|nr:cobalamin-dependent protein [Saprospiraceae bacterium]
MKPTALLTTIPSDSHNWNLIYMQLLLQENGFEVINLGACTTYEEVAQACCNIFPEIVVVSTVNGHGYLEGKTLIEKIRAIPEMKDIPVYIGGKLSTDKNMSYRYSVELENAGYSSVYPEARKIADFISELKKQNKKAA